MIIDDLKKPTFEKMKTLEISEFEQTRRTVKKNVFTCCCCTLFRKKKDELLEDFDSK